MNHRLHFIEQLGLILVAVATLIALFIGELPLTLGVAIGGVLAVANFYALRRVMGAIMQSDNPPRQALLTIVLLMKFGLLGTVLYLVMVHLPIDATGMLVGFSLVVVSIFAEGFRAVFRATPQSTD